MFRAVCGAASLGLLPHLWVCLWLNAPLLRVWFGLRLRQLCDVKDEADAQVELPQNSSELRDQIKLHDLTQERVVSGCMSLELKDKVGCRKTEAE